MMSVALKTESAAFKEHYSSTWNTRHQTKLTGSSRESFGRCTHPPDETSTPSQVTRLEFQATYLELPPLCPHLPLKQLIHSCGWISQWATPIPSVPTGAPHSDPVPLGHSEPFVGLLAVSLLSHYCALTSRSSTRGPEIAKPCARRRANLLLDAPSFARAAL